MPHQGLTDESQLTLPPQSDESHPPLFHNVEFTFCMMHMTACQPLSSALNVYRPASGIAGQPKAQFPLSI